MIRVILIGAGRICQQAHFPVMLMSDVEVVAISDPSPRAQKEAAGQFPKASMYADYQDIREQADAAVITSPNALHYEQTKYFLEKGLHVLCEKPLGTVRKEAEELVALARDKGLTLQTGYFRRFQESSREIMDMLADGRYGALLRCVAAVGQTDDRSGPPSLYDFGLSRGGCTIDFGPHVIDRLLSWFESLELSEYRDDNRGSGVESTALMRLTGKRGGTQVPITFLSSRTSPIGSAILLEFEKATVVSEFNVGHELKVVEGRLSGLQGGMPSFEYLRVSSEKQFLDYFKDQWDEFVHRIQGGDETRSSLEDAIEVTGLIEQCYKERKELELPWERTGR